MLEARNDREAIEVLLKAERLPRLILLDLAMPILDGGGFLKWRETDPIVTEIPVIVVSGSSLFVPLEGVDAFLRKPVEVTGPLRLIADYRYSNIERKMFSRVPNSLAYCRGHLVLLSGGIGGFGHGIYFR